MVLPLAAGTTPLNEMSIHIKEATKSDIPLISEMAERIWRSHYTPIIGEAQVNYMLRKGYSDRALLQSMNDGEKFFLCMDDEQCLGYVSLIAKNAGEYFLNKFYIDIAQQGRGTGKNIFALLLLEFPDLRTIRLQVNRMNYKSINFYFRLGFTIEYAKDFDIGDGFSMDDFVMIWEKK